MMHAPSLDKAMSWVEVEHEDLDVWWGPIVNLSVRNIRDAEVAEIPSREGSGDEELFVIAGDLWLLTWGYVR